MRIHFHGAVRTVTGSMHLLEVGERRVLLDCGLYQGKRKEAFERNRNLPFEPKALDAVVLSHAHIDHSGNLPTLVRRGYRGPVYATPATVDLCDIMLRDSAHLQQRDVEYVNKKRRRQGKNPFEPLYVLADVERLMGIFQSHIVDDGTRAHGKIYLFALEFLYEHPVKNHFPGIVSYVENGLGLLVLLPEDGVMIYHPVQLLYSL